MQKSSVAPTVSPERSAEYESLDLLVENQAFLPRALQHPLNSRRAPTVSMRTTGGEIVRVVAQNLNTPLEGVVDDHWHDCVCCCIQRAGRKLDDMRQALMYPRNARSVTLTVRNVIDRLSTGFAI